MQLVRRNIVLWRPDPDKEKGPIVSGDVARVGDRLICRWSIPDANGEVLEGMREWRENENPMTAPRPPVGCVFSPAGGRGHSSVASQPADQLGDDQGGDRRECE